MLILTLLGARPQFIKSAMMSRALATHNIPEIVVHSGQHYDAQMDRIFFEQLQLQEPAVNLRVGSRSANAQVAEIMLRLEAYLLSLKHLPTLILVYGDTNTTLAGALVANKLQIPLAHVEAGLRSFNRKMPEETNRVVTDHLATWNFCPTETAVSQLVHEGITKGVALVGDVMFDATEHFAAKALHEKPLATITTLPKDGFYLATVHRAENTDDLIRLQDIFHALNALDLPILLPLHPRTKAKWDALSHLRLENLHFIEPVGYLEMLTLLQSCRKVLTDSGGLQKEAYWLKKQVLTLRTETEWGETLHDNWNICVGADSAVVLQQIRQNPTAAPKPFGRIASIPASTLIAQQLCERL